MREIKFRCWNKERKLMDYDLSIEDYYGSINRIFNEEDEFPSRDYIFMQYTGLKDCKGTEIYDGDIVRHPGSSKPCIVEFKYCAFIVGYHTGSSTPKSPKLVNSKTVVLGNIYEHSDLLEAK